MQSFYVTKTGEVISDEDMNVYDERVQESLLDRSDTTDIKVYFNTSDYSRVWGRDTNAEGIARGLASIVAKHAHEIEAYNKFDYTDDVRYTVYWHEMSHKFIPVCIQDFDIPDYDEENFVKSNGDMIEFYRNVYGNNDSLVEQMCSYVCDELNSSRVIV